MRGTILESIVETKRQEVARAREARPLKALKAEIAERTPPRDFYSAVVAPGRIGLIGEIKRASPSAGLIRADFDAAAIAMTYEAAGARALSVLTDRQYFQGDLSLIAAVKAVAGLPVLRKDFLIDEYQVYESRAAGADAVLFIAEILPIENLERMSALAAGLGMAGLVEVHNAEQLTAVVHVVRPERRVLLGINNRDLHSQRTNLDTTRSLAKLLPPGMPFVSESGIQCPADVVSMRQCAASAVLVGESLMRADDLAAKVRELFGEEG